MKEKSMTEENIRLLLKNNRTLIDKVNLLLEKLEHYTSAPSSEWLDSGEVCRFLKISSRTLSNYCDKLLLTGYRLGGKLLFRRSEIEEKLNSQSL